MLPEIYLNKNVDTVKISKAEAQIALLRYNAPDFYAKIARLLAGE
jgi:hypothetical protein